jgi:hypothetical protein
MTLLVARFNKGVYILILLCVFIGWLVEMLWGKEYAKLVTIGSTFFSKELNLQTIISCLIYNHLIRYSILQIWIFFVYSNYVNYFKKRGVVQTLVSRSYFFWYLNIFGGWCWTWVVSYNIALYYLQILVCRFMFF